MISPRVAKSILEIYSCGGQVSTGLVKAAITVLVDGEPDAFVESCLLKRKKIEEEKP